MKSCPVCNYPMRRIYGAEIIICDQCGLIYPVKCPEDLDRWENRDATIQSDMEHEKAMSEKGGH